MQGSIERAAGRVKATGETVLCDGAAEPAFGLTLGLVRLGPAQRWQSRGAAMETAVVVLSGRGRLSAGSASLPFARHSWIEEAPAAIHAGSGTAVDVSADEPSEMLFVQTRNESAFAARAISAERVRNEERGAGKVGGAAQRRVRTVFDRTDAPAQAKLVVGEVVNLPGRWSSYPPHHHRQPEIYYYRFDPPQGYGHAECGDDVYKVHEHDVLRIPPGKDHAQCAAPGYHMYYLWAIRHLEGDPYTGFETSEAHRWTFE